MLACSCIGIQFSFSQNTQSLLVEPEFNVVLQSDKPWSYSFGLAHRSLVKRISNHQIIEKHQTEHLELSHYTRYTFNPKIDVAIRVRYRFKEVFDDLDHDELRFIEEIEYTHANWRFKPKHRLRMEQRFQELVSYRIRYQLAASQPLSKTYSLALATEALYSFSKNAKPEPEQRFGLTIKNSSFDNLKLNLGFEYRLDNYIRNLEREYFILTGATLEL